MQHSALSPQAADGRAIYAIWWSFMPVDKTLDERVGQAIGRLDRWLDGMRGPQGYGGPVAHWWTSCLVYAGPMLDWRYEGIVCGYLNLYRATGSKPWLDKAIRAADDLLAGQWPDGRFWNSSFEFGPAIGGTPHEAAADVALLELAHVLRVSGLPGWEKYVTAAQRNIQMFQIGRLWTGRGFRDQPDNQALVANKNATTLEALLLYQALADESMQGYIDGAAQVVLGAQVLHGIRAGAVVHAGTFQRRLAYGIYTARCTSGLARLTSEQPRPEYRDFIARAVQYLGKLILPGTTLLGHYRDGRPVAAPQWISPSGDLLRAFVAAGQHVDVPEEWAVCLTRMLVDAQQPTGGIPTASGFAVLGSSRLFGGMLEFRDVLPVVGWCDKAFRALTMVAPDSVTASTAAATAPTEVACQWQGRRCEYREDDRQLSLTDDRSGELLYLWHKSESYPAHMELWK
jgi:hypothetical protein